jgi:hypothetical protein
MRIHSKWINGLIVMWEELVDRKHQFTCGHSIDMLDIAGDRRQ